MKFLQKLKILQFKKIGKKAQTKPETITPKEQKKIEQLLTQVIIDSQKNNLAKLYTDDGTEFTPENIKQLPLKEKIDAFKQLYEFTLKTYTPTKKEE